MPACCAPFEDAADQQFNRKKVAAELKRYRDKGPGPTTRLLEEGIAEAGHLAGTLLDVGSGFGSLTFRLLTRGIARAVAIDASSAYIETAREEADRLGETSRVRFVHADFVTAAPELPAATVVTLDRVVCCYPSYQPLLTAAIQHADRCLAFSYPRDVWYVRLGLFAENGKRWLSGNAFRTFVHPTRRMEELVRRAGFTLSTRRETWMWSVDVYTRGLSAGREHDNPPKVEGQGARDSD
jgi:magnesium-protoporphyrin O-methyltransferase